MAQTRPLIVGTRGTRLARAQAEEIVAALRAKMPDLAVEIREVSTAGDEAPERPVPELGEPGVFVRGLERALQAREIDLAVHSAKDLPTQLGEGLAIGAFARRRDARDCLVTAEGFNDLRDLPMQARVGTGSPRREAQLRERRPDLQVVPLRGSVETRLAELDAGRVDAVVLAVAGLQRLGLQSRLHCPLDDREFIPAAGQGALAIEVRAGEWTEVCAALMDPVTKDELEAERAFLRAVGAGCEAPVGVRAWVCEREMLVKGFVGKPDGTVMHRAGRVSPRSTARINGQLLASMILAEGGKDVLAAWRESVKVQ